MNKFMEQQEKYFDFMNIIHATMKAYKIPESDEVCKVMDNFSEVMEKIIAPDVHFWRGEDGQIVKQTQQRALLEQNDAASKAAHGIYNLLNQFDLNISKANFVAFFDKIIYKNMPALSCWHKKHPADKDIFYAEFGEEDTPECCQRLLPDVQIMAQTNSHRPPMARAIKRVRLSR